MLPNIAFLFFLHLTHCIGFIFTHSPVYENAYLYSDIYKNMLHHANMKQNPPIGVVELNCLLLVNAV